MGTPRIRVKMTAAANAAAVTAKEKISASAVTTSENRVMMRPIPSGSHNGQVRMSTSHSAQLEELCCCILCWFW